MSPYAGVFVVGEGVRVHRSGFSEQIPNVSYFVEMPYLTEPSM